MSGKDILDAINKLIETLFAWPFLFFLLIVIFRKPIGKYIPDLIKRLTKAQIGGNTFEFTEPKTVSTPIGSTQVSNLPTKQAAAAPLQELTCSYFSRKFNFQISWPTKTWMVDLEKGSQVRAALKLPESIEVPVFVFRSEKMGNFQPNVNVMVEPVGQMSVKQYMDLSVASMKKMNWEILQSEVDEDTQGGVLVYLSNTQAGKIYQFARLAVAAGLAYVVTASQLPPDDQMDQQVRADLSGILNSFRLVKAA